MYEKILVPLGGSRASEAILPSVAWLARYLGSEVTLLNVAEPLRLQGGAHPTRRFRLANVNILEETAETELKGYLHALVKWLGKRRVAANPVVVVGDASREIVAQAMLGSVTDAVIRSSHLPILVVGPKGSGELQVEGIRLERVVVPWTAHPWLRWHYPMWKNWPPASPWRLS